jgi:hypothetical protein
MFAIHQKAYAIRRAAILIMGLLCLGPVRGYSYECYPSNWHEESVSGDPTTSTLDDPGWPIYQNTTWFDTVRVWINSQTTASFLKLKVGNLEVTDNNKWEIAIECHMLHRTANGDWWAEEVVVWRDSSSVVLKNQNLGRNPLIVQTAATGGSDLTLNAEIIEPLPGYPYTPPAPPGLPQQVSSLGITASAANGHVSASGGGNMAIYAGESVTISSTATAPGHLSAHNISGYTAGPSLFSIPGGAANLPATAVAIASARTVTWTPPGAGVYTLYAEAFIGISPGERRYGISGWPGFAGGPFGGFADKRITINVKDPKEIANIFPVHNLSMFGELSINRPIPLTLTVVPPAVTPAYPTIIKVLEWRGRNYGQPNQETFAGHNWVEVPISQWTETSGTTWTISRPPLTQPGEIVYHVSTYNRWSVPLDNMTEYRFQTTNRIPVAQAITGATQVHYGEAATYTYAATDADGDLVAMETYFADPALAFGANNNFWPNRQDFPISGFAVAKDRTFTFTAIGIWQAEFRVGDSGGFYNWNNLPASSNCSPLLNINVSKTTPRIDNFDNNITLAIGQALTSELHLCAKATNPHNVSFDVHGRVTYKIASSSNTQYPAGTGISAGVELPAGIYTIEASISESSFYNAASKQVQLTVRGNPQDDDDVDGIPNGVEGILGTNSNSSGSNPNNMLKIKILTPIAE